MFITFEGIDGAGKSTQLAWLAEDLRAAGRSVVTTREPGGTPLGERLRELLLAPVAATRRHPERQRASVAGPRSLAPATSGSIQHSAAEPPTPSGPDEAPLAPEAELALLFAARAQHAAQVIRPALARGDMVLCDRFTDATEAYQGVARGLGAAAVAALHHLLLGDLWPDATLILDLEPAQAMARARRREPRADRMEAEGLAFLTRVRQGYQAIAAREPHRCLLIAAADPPPAVRAAIARALAARFPALLPHA
ncbi:MAG: dTMP kinase [Terriglobales bacterium]